MKIPLLWRLLAIELVATLAVVAGFSIIEVQLQSPPLSLYLVRGLTIAAVTTLVAVVYVTRLVNALEASEKRWLSYLQGLPVPVFALDAKGRPAFANEAARKVLGRGLVPSEPEGLSVTYPSYVEGTDDRYPEDRMPIVRALRRKETSVVSDVELERDGSRIPIEAWAAPILDEKGNVEYAIAVFFDISDKKRLSKALGDLKVSERLLKQRTKALEQSNRDLEQFASVASHDLQEPLRMVASYVELLRKRYQGKLDKDADEFIQFAVEGATRMQRLIDDLLRFSRVQTKRGDLKESDTQALLDEAVHDLGEALKESKGKVEADGLPTILCDPPQLRQVFQNLIANALKFRGEEPPQVKVSASRDGEGWHFIVKDNGIGIDPKHFDKLFVIFQRLHSTAEYEGTGMGLAICKRIIERHGGNIWVESEPGKGAEFHFTIPSAPG